jgi:hypothetical protein
MMANEASVSVSFASVIVAALAVLAGFGFNEDEFPKPLIAQMILAVTVTLIALIVYSNSTGKLSKLEFKCVDEYMQIGNIVSEFGGVYPMLQVLPISVAAITDDWHVGGPTSAAACVAIFAYQRSEFGILHRYKDLRKRQSPTWPRRRWVGGLELVLAFSPVIGYASWEWFRSTGYWTIGNVAVLLLAAGWCMRTRRPVGQRAATPAGRSR